MADCQKADSIHPADRKIFTVHIREASVEDASGIAQVRVSSWQTTYHGIIPQDYLDSLSTEEYTHHWQGILAAEGRQGYTCVAESQSGEIIGFALGGVERTQEPLFQGELYSLYLLERYQNRGIGKNMVYTIARYFLQQGINSMLAWVLAENPARSFYRALGGEQVYEKPVMISGKRFKQVAYGWPDLISLVNDP